MDCTRRHIFSRAYPFESRSEALAKQLHSEEVVETRPAGERQC